MGRREGSCSCHSWVPALPCSREQLGRLWPHCCQPGSAGAAEPATIPCTRAPQRELCARCGCLGRWGWVEEQSSAFFPGSGSGFPQARALCHSRRGEIRVSLSRSTGPGAVALQVLVAQEWPVPVAGLGLCWERGALGACCGRVTALGVAGGFSACGAGRRQVLAARWCALELGAEPRGRGLSVELAGRSFSGCLAT